MTNTPPPAPTGFEAKALQELRTAAAKLIETIDLELSGTRDGSGYWSGGHALTKTWREAQRGWENYKNFAENIRGLHWLRIPNWI